MAENLTFVLNKLELIIISKLVCYKMEKTLFVLFGSLAEVQYLKSINVEKPNVKMTVLPSARLLKDYLLETYN